MKQAQKMQKDMGRIQEELRERVVDATAGGGMVTAYVNGAQELISIKLDPEVVDPEDVTMLEDLITAAVSEAMKESQKIREEEMAKLTGGINIPGMFG